MTTCDLCGELVMNMQRFCDECQHIWDESLVDENDETFDGDHTQCFCAL